MTQLPEMFGESSSFFSIRHQCLHLVEREADEYGAQADVVNRVLTAQITLIDGGPI